MRSVDEQELREKLKQEAETNNEELPTLEKLTDATNADRLVAAEGEDLLYCYELNSWLIWDECRWQEDISEQSRARMEKTMRAHVASVARTGNRGDLNIAAGCLDTHRITNGLREAQKKLGVNIDKLDTHPFLLTFKNGTLDLITGALGESRKEHLLTKMVHKNYVPDANCSQFLKFIHHALKPDEVRYLQKVVGYFLTGDTSEKLFFALYGEGDTGKTTLLEILRLAAKEFCVRLQVDTLVGNRTGDGAAQEDLASVRGARTALTSELDEEKRLSVAMVKRMVQGQTEITCSPKYKKKMTFLETHKLVMDTNNLPVIPASEKALWGRLVIIVFNNPVPKNLQIKHLAEQIVRNEGEGFLAWAVEGQLRRQQEEMQDVPAAFADKKNVWQEKMDSIKQFVDECCTTGDPKLRENRECLYEEYEKFSRGGRPVSAKKFTERLESIGYRRSADRRYYEGLKLNHATGESEPTQENLYGGRSKK